MEKSLSLSSRIRSVVYPTRFLFVLAATTATGLVRVAAGAQQAPATPTALLKWSMSKYAAMRTFQAECKWSQVYPGTQGSKEERTIQYARPNQFKMVTTDTAAHATQTCVCDGKKMVEYMTSGNAPALSYAAPPSLAEARSIYLQHPMFCGTLLYRFFGGAGKYGALVDAAKLAPKFAAPVTLDGQKCQTVTFWVTEMYGTTEVAIGAQDGLVHRIRYNSEPQMEQTKKMVRTPEFLAQMKQAGVNVDAKDLLKFMPASSQTTETYSKINVGQPIDASVFTAQAPEGKQEQAMGGGAEPQPPVALGKPAPDISVTRLDGVKKKLADFRGKVVLIDFWATWCPPCRKGLPETQKFYTEYGQKGLAVLTVSDESKPTVTAFLKKNNFTFPAYLDPGGATNKAYNIAAIPTVAIIDKKGNLAAYMFGLSPREAILVALKRAGLGVR